MEAYQFIKDEEKLKDFCDILPRLKSDEYLGLYLAARRKYLKEEEKDIYRLGGTDMIRREFIKRSDFETVKEAIINICVPKNTYADKEGRPIPEHAICLYITTNPLSGKKAAGSMMKKLVDMVMNDDPYFNLISIAKTELHKNVGSKHFIDFDVDVDESKQDEYETKIRGFLGGTPHFILKTRGGFHVLVKKNEIDPLVASTFYQNIITLPIGEGEEIESKGHTMVPVAGCQQSDFVPYIKTT